MKKQKKKNNSKTKTINAQMYKKKGCRKEKEKNRYYLLRETALNVQLIICSGLNPPGMMIYQGSKTSTRCYCCC